MTTAQLALSILKPIPEQEFIIGDFTDYNHCCCSLGHLNRCTSDDPSDYISSPIDNSTDIDWYEFAEISQGITIDCVNLVQVNDGLTNDSRFRQDTPKKRVVALLNVMINEGY